MRDAPSRGFAGLFPGQLSEKAGMGEALHREYSFVRDFFSEVERRSDVSIPEVFFGDGSPALHESRPAQIGVFAVSVAILDVLNLEFDLQPEAVAGYSLGTYAALVAAGCIGRWDALEVILEVERLLSNEGPEGMMGFIIGLRREAVIDLLAQVSSGNDLAIGNENAPQQFVITGVPGAVREAITQAKRVALSAELLPLPFPMHSPRLGEMTKRVRTFVVKNVEVHPPRITALYAPMTGGRVVTREDALDVLSLQIGRPSLWERMLRAMWSDGFHRYAELGPGHVLAKMLRWTLRQGQAVALDEPVAIERFALGRFTIPPGMTRNTVGEEPV